MPLTRKQLASAAFGIALGVLPGNAQANGRFPGAYQLVIRDKNVAMATSFGVITSADALVTTRWICERGVGYDPAQQNELGLAIFGDNGLTISGPAGLTRSTDRGCSNAAVPGPAGVLWMTDVSAEPSNGATGLAISRRARESLDCEGQLFESQDNGATWVAIGSKLPEGFCALTVDSAHTNPDRVYVSGQHTGADGSQLVGQLLVSSDRGVTWVARDIPNETNPFIGALDPMDEDTVYIRTLKGLDRGSLVVTHDGGGTFREIATLTGVPLNFYGVTGVAVSPDGSKLAYGSLNEGLFLLEKGASEAKKQSDLKVMCLTWTDEALFACSAPNLGGPFFVGRSTDEGASFVPILTSLEVGDDVSDCPADTPSGSLCPGEWNAVCTRLPDCDAGAAAGSDAGADAGPAPGPPKLGCLCGAGPGSVGGPLVLLSVGGIMLGALRRYARRS
jgi:hypothetical protein